MSGTTPVFEPLSQGLVTARDPAMLREGELTAAANAEYRPNDTSIQKVKGRTKFVTAALAAAVKGLKYIEFDDNTNQLLAYSDTMYHIAAMDTSETGPASFTALLSNIVDTATTGSVGTRVLTTTTTNGFASVREGYGVTHSGGSIPASTTVVRLISSTSVQISADLTGAVLAAETITFTPSVGDGLTLDAIQYNNKHILLNGITNQILNSALTLRPLGLRPVTEPIATPVKVTGHWSAILGTGYWFFITTEVINTDTPDEVESTNTVEPARIPYIQMVATDISGTPKTVEITRPLVTNPNATHWRVYAANNPDAPTAPPLSSFQLMAQNAIDATKSLAGDVTLYDTKFAGAQTNVSFNNAAAVLGAADNQFAVSNTSGASITTSTFGYGSFSGSFSGIEVTVRFGVTSIFANAKSIILYCRLNYGAGPTATVEQSKVFTNTNITEIRTAVFGSNSDTWGRAYTAWVAGDVSHANFGARIAIERLGDGTMPSVFIDSVEIRVYTANTTSTIVNYGSYFPTISISVGGVTSVIGSHGLPAVATTGDVWDDQFVFNDVNDLSILRYTLPGQIEYAPALYFINFETKYTDEVTNFGRLNTIGLCGLKNNLYRINYLPRESDAEFDRGRCYEPIAEGYGVVGTHAAKNITLPGEGIVRAFVSYGGVHITDGFRVHTWTDDIDWAALVSTPATASGTDYLKNCVLEDYPILYQLKLFYTPLGATVNSAAIYFHYHPQHMKENGKPKITGPITVNARSATLGRVTNMPVLVTGGDTGFALGKVFLEDRGFVDNSVTATPNVSGFSVRTREMYVGGIGRAFTINTTFVRHRGDTTSTVTVTPRQRSNNEAQASITAKTFTTTNGGAAEVPFHINAESVDFTYSEEAVVGANAIRIIGMNMEVVDTGLPERRTN